MQSKQKYLDEVCDVLDSTTRDHATSFAQTYCFDSIIDEGYARIALKISMTIDDIEPHIRDELRRICSLLRCTPLIVGERTRKRPLQDGVVHSRGSIQAITLETLRRMLEEKSFPLILAKKGGIYVVMNGQKLKTARKDNNLSRGDIAHAIGLSRRAIYEYERGTMNPTIDVALRLEELLQVQLIEPLNLLETQSAKDQPTLLQGKGETYLAKRTVEVFSRLGCASTITQDTPFDILTSLRHQIVLSYLKHRLDKLNRERLGFLAKLAKVLDEEPTIIASESTNVKTINGIPVISLKELLAVEKPKEFLTLIHSRRGA